ncbi:glycosyltransferase family 2 protein, partial [Patescibacteria group bacterium]|nr:glycosyltransferase family 2 protein [Patescibacteria group bacterium]
KKTKNNFILLLNPDTKIIDNSIIKMFNSIKKKKRWGIIGGKIKQYKNNKKNYLTATSKPTFFTGLFEFTNLKKLFPNNIFTNKFWIENRHKNNKTIEVDSLCGAFLLFRKYLNKKINLFDKKYFLYLEDIDFCLNTKQKGYKVIYYPKSKIEHYGGGSNNSKYNTVLKHWYKSRKYFFKKHTNIISSAILNIIFDTEKNLLSLYHYIKNEPAE